VERLEAGEAIVVAGEELKIEDVLLQRSPKGDAAVATDGRITVALDTRLDEALRLEGIAREFVSSIQNARKDAGLDITDRIALRWECQDPFTARALSAHTDYVAKEVLAVEVNEGPGVTSADVNGVEVRFSIEKRAPT